MPAPVWGDQGVLEVNFWFAEAARAARGQATGSSQPDINARAARNAVNDLLNNNSDLNSLATEIGLLRADMITVKSGVQNLTADPADGNFLVDAICECVTP